MTENTSPPTPEVQTDPQFLTYLAEDQVYQNMLRTLDTHSIRLRLSIRYVLVMFAIFLVFAWIVNNRVIMFGFSGFPLLARIRDGLFGVMAGLFSLTLWYGSAVWFYQKWSILTLRVIAGFFFLAVLIALYFPL